MDPQPAYVLHARPYRETSLLLEVFSRDQGRLGVVARGVRGAKGQALRAALQPLQPLLLSLGGRGDLLHLRGAEAAGPALQLSGDSLLSAFYVNELVMRLLPRGEEQQALFWRYAECLGALADASAALAWELRRFERDLLSAAGYGLDLELDAEGRDVEEGVGYQFNPETGLWPASVTLPAEQTYSGTALLALARDEMPEAFALRELRRLMRVVLRHHLGERGLRSWQVLADLATPMPGHGSD